MNFKIERFDIEGPALIRGRQFADHRGWFSETWSRDAFSLLGIEADFVQDNQSLSRSKGTVRGLHFQKPPYEQAKLVRVLAGSIFDVAVDIRPGSRTFGRWCGMALTADSTDQLFIPRGFAHGFMTLEKGTIVAYRVDAPYHPASDSGICWDDRDIEVSWPNVGARPVLSDKDSRLPSLRQYMAQHVDDGMLPGLPHRRSSDAAGQAVP